MMARRLADASALALSGVIDAPSPAAARRRGAYGKARAGGAAPGTIVSAALRQVAQLHKVLLAIEDGAGLEQAIGSLRPPPHFRRKPLIEGAIKAWTAQRLLGVMAQLNEAVLQTRRAPDLAETIAQRALMSVAMAGRRKN